MLGRDATLPVLSYFKKLMMAGDYSSAMDIATNL
jgi:hypothetical protein